MAHKASFQHWFDAPSNQQAPVRIRTIHTVALHLGRPEFRPSSPSFHGRNRLYQRQQLGNVIDIGGRQNDGKRGVLRVRDHVVLAPIFPSNRKIRPHFFPRAQRPQRNYPLVLTDLHRAVNGGEKNRAQPHRPTQKRQQVPHY